MQKSEKKVEDSVSKWMFHFWNLFEEIERASDSTQRQEKTGMLFFEIFFSEPFFSHIIAKNTLVEATKLGL